ncbi:hypothetical protein HB780_01865 (plasmid) [Rhizobium lusitanum]|nr:hypothetical protein [Rhizobium lusitanum]QND44552.1 hypothetical protein HB780_01865 [Rhizobium lusitanum]
MYSYEDMVRAVGRFIKLGKRVKATIRQLGYLLDTIRGNKNLLDPG